MKITRKLILALGLSTVAASMAHAESRLMTGTGNAAARVNMRVVVPYELFFAVGFGATGARVNNPQINTITYTYGGVSQLGGGSPSGWTNMDVRIYCNGGQTRIDVSHPPNLVSGPNTIPFTQIDADSLSPTTFPVPEMGGGPVFPSLNGNSRITNRTATWRYRYLNQVAPAAGTFTGQVTYTASVP
jgi:hypothetical protein